LAISTAWRSQKAKVLPFFFSASNHEQPRSWALAHLQLAKRLGVTPQMPADDPLKPAVQAEMTALKGAAKGAAFDRTYIDQEIGIHKAVIDLAGKAHDAAQNEELKKLIEQAGPVLQKHLDHAEQIQKKLGKPTA